MENQVFTLFGGLKKQQWKRLNIQGIWNQSPKATSSGLCINGIIYYIECINIGGFYHPDFNELVWFDISFERFGYIKMPITLELSPFEELVLVNYKGKLGCLHYNKDSAEMWTMEDHNKTKQQEWSKIVFSAHDLVERLGYGGFCIAGATPNGEIVIMPRTLEPAQPFYAFYYDPKQNRCAGGQFERFLGELKSGELNIACEL
ncbi:unnamed protein product [Arabis nemorensis]|uniref:F-box associated beta-propeller type 3 domain-containing protein n=1 Tax=Arabis nemorensis TaxID=586526 RepID=A0A565CWK9_9BRAS|nr:unnamed protein product [Arabis nemorensis]